MLILPLSEYFFRMVWIVRSLHHGFEFIFTNLYSILLSAIIVHTYWVIERFNFSHFLTKMLPRFHSILLSSAKTVQSRAVCGVWFWNDSLSFHKLQSCLGIIHQGYSHTQLQFPCPYTGTIDVLFLIFIVHEGKIYSKHECNIMAYLLLLIATKKPMHDYIVVNVRLDDN